MFVVGKLDPVWSIGATHKLPMSDIRPAVQPMGECSIVCFAVIWILRRFSRVSPKAGYGRHIAHNS